MQLCVTVTVNTRCSPSPSSQLHGDSGGERREGVTHCSRPYVCVCVGVCVCISVASFVAKKSGKKKKMWLRACCLCVCDRIHVCVCVCVCVCSSIFCMWRNVFACACVCVCVCVCVLVWASQPSAVFSSSPTVIPLSAICPSLKRQLFSEGPLGEKRNNWAITLLLLSSQRCSAPPCLAFFFQEVFAARLFFFSPFLPLWDFIYPCAVVSLTLSLFLSVNWWCWLCFA